MLKCHFNTFCLHQSHGAKSQPVKIHQNMTYLFVIVVLALLLVDGLIEGVALGHVDGVTLFVILGVVDGVIH